MNNQLLTALYYPYSRCINEVNLKFLSLLFNEIVFLDPLEDEFREFLLFSDKGCHLVPSAVRERWKKTKDTWEYLKEKGVVKTENPTLLLKKYDDLLTASFASDMDDENFVSTSYKDVAAGGPWKMLVSRIPPKINESFDKHQTLTKLIREKPKADEFFDSDYQIGVFAWEHYDHHGLREYLLEKLGGEKAQDFAGRSVDKKLRNYVDNSKIDSFDLLYMSGAGTCTENGEPFGMHPYRYVDTVKYSNGEPIRVLSFAQGSSISISTTLLVAELNGYVPVTDSQLHQNLLNIKFQRATKEHEQKPSSFFPKFKRSPKIQQKYQILAQNIVLSILSPTDLENLTIVEVYKFREANLDALTRFWTKIAEVSYEISTMPDEPSFPNEVLKLIDKKILPEAQTLGDTLDLTKRKMWGNLLSKVVTSVTPATALSVFTGMSIGNMLAFGATAALAGLGIAVPQVLEYWKNKQEVGQNWLSFLIDLKSRAQNSK